MAGDPAAPQASQGDAAGAPAPSQFTIREAAGPDDCGTARELFVEYAAWLGVDLCFQGFNEELATLPGKYAAPSGCLLLAFDRDANAAGCVAIRALSSDSTGTSCELKRLWVRPAYRKSGLGRALTHAAFDAARRIGYRTIKLDTLPSLMPDAVAMYRGFGFVECAPYYHNPIAGSMYMECAL